MITRQIVTAILLLGFIIPFVFLRTFFPFYRFGMFAEPVKGEAFKEKFEVTFNDGKGNPQLFYAPNVGLNARSFEYLKRNYYYRGEGEKLLEVISSLHKSQASNWSLLHLRVAEFNSVDTLDKILLP